MIFTWDDKKDQKNFEKHGVWFHEAQMVILNPLTLFAPNEHPDGDRFEYLGESPKNRILYVVTVEKSDNEIRIISARKATKKESKQYEEERI